MSRMRARGRRGFTLIELLVVMALLGIILTMGYTSLANMLVRGKMVGAANQTASLVRLAHFEAIKRGQTVYFVADTAGKAAWVYADVNNSGAYEPAQDGPILSRYDLPSGVLLAGPGDFVEGNSNAVVGFTGSQAGFATNGSVDKLGAVRLRDGRGNLLEVRVSPASTARIAIRKYFGDPTSATDDLTQYFENGEASHTWTWQ
ncbi:MAG: GspH/FimT family pseudopilin [Acidobacteriota bacterium]